MAPKARRRTDLPPLNELIGSAEVCRLTTFHRRHIYRLTADGILPVYKVNGSRNLYWIRDIEALVTPPADRRSA